MKTKITNHAKINDEGKLEIYTDNAIIIGGQINTQIKGCDKFEIDGASLLKIYAMMQDKSVTTINCKNSVFHHIEVIVVGENSEAKELAGMCKIF